MASHRSLAALLAVGFLVTAGSASAQPQPGHEQNLAVQNDLLMPVVSADTTDTGAALKPPLAVGDTYNADDAKARMTALGYRSITNLRRDSTSIWRADGVRDGKPVKISLDYQGNVVGQP